MPKKTIAFFPEGAYGPALNSVGIAQACRDNGHRAVFVCDPGFAGVFQKFGFDEYQVALSEPMDPEEMAKYWVDFVNHHIPNFRKQPYDQIDNYIRECWEAIVDTSIWAQKGLAAVLEEISPDLICVDNVILFPAVKQYGVPWVRIVSCSENEIPDDNIAPYLSGCSEGDEDAQRAFRAKYHDMLVPIHDRFNQFLVECGEEEYPVGQFCEASRYMNMLLYPKAVQFNRSKPLDPERFQYLEGCVRSDQPYEVPDFASQQDGALIYVSFGSLGSGDTDLMQRLIDALAHYPCRVLLNVGDHTDKFVDLPPNIKVNSWFPQPSVIPQVDAVIHHGGNNTFTECLYFGVPAIIMAFAWDGHDNATRIQETGHGLKLDRYDWSEGRLHESLNTILNSPRIAQRLATTSKHMQMNPGARKAAQIISDILKDSP